MRATLGRVVIGIGGVVLGVLFVLFAAAMWFGEGRGASVSKFLSRSVPG